MTRALPQWPRALTNREVVIIGMWYLMTEREPKPGQFVDWAEIGPARSVFGTGRFVGGGFMSTKGVHVRVNAADTYWSPFDEEWNVK